MNKPKATAKIRPKRWAAYAAAGAASALASGSAEAAITYVNVNQTLDATGVGTVSATFNLEFPDGALYFQHQTAGMSAGGTLGAANFGAYAAHVGSVGDANNLTLGQNISTLGFQSGFGLMAYATGYGEFLNSGISYLAFTFFSNEGMGLQPRYGWARVDMSGSPLNSFTIVDYAYGDINEPIAVGAIPEPGSLGLLAAGGVGLLAWRRRRKDAQAA